MPPKNYPYTALCTALWLHILGGSRSILCLSQILNIEKDLLLTTLQQLEFTSLITRDTSRNRWQCHNFTPELCRYFFRTFRPRVDDDAGRCIVLFSGKDYMESCLALQGMLQKLMDNSSTNGASACLELLVRRLGLWAKMPHDESSMRQFIDIVLAVQGDVFAFDIYTQEACNLSEPARDMAITLGDVRAKALIDLVGGCLENFSGEANPTNPAELLTSGLDTMATLGDVDIVMQLSHFLSMLHYFQGNFRPMLEAFDKAQLIPQFWKCRYFTDMHPLYMSPAAQYLGMYPHALGMTISALRNAEIQGERYSILWWHTLLAVTFLQIGQKQEALEHISEVVDCADAEATPKLYLWIWRALALYHASVGNIQASYRIMRDCLATRARFGHGHFAYTAVWILELFALYDAHGCPPLAGFSVQVELEKIVKSPNVHLQGMAYRVQAMQKKRAHVPVDDIIATLQKSTQLFAVTGNTFEQGRGMQLLAEIMEQQGDNTAAQSLLDQAASLLARFPWVGPLQHTMPAAPIVPEAFRLWRGHIMGGDPVPSVDSALDVLANIEPETALEHVFMLLVNTLQRELGAERAVLLQESALGAYSYVRGSNCTLEEYNSASFISIIDAIRTKHQRGNSKHATYVSKDSVGLSLSLSVAEKCIFILYLESSFVAGAFLCMGAPQLERLARSLTRELRTAIKIDMARHAVAHAEQERARAFSGDMPRRRYDHGTALRATIEQARHAALTDASILLLGETGVGKEVMAERIHEYSGRSGTFIVVHPGSTPESLFESEFFGHEKGAFTGAVRQKIGLFEMAHEGTFFIDEVADIPLSFQTKLLRVLQDHSFMRVGGMHMKNSNFRLVAATNRDLWAEVEKGLFREDLYYRIAVIPITIPPLRMRRADIPDLAQLFVDDYSRRYGRVPLPLSPDILEQFQNYDWPGNVRELKNVIERAVILNPDQPLAFILGPKRKNATPDATPAQETTLYHDLPTLEELGKRYMQHVLTLTQGKVVGPNGAEQILGMKRSTLYAKIQYYGLQGKMGGYQALGTGAAELVRRKRTT